MRALLAACLALLWAGLPARATDWATLMDAIETNAVDYATLHATLKPCTPARDLRDRYLDAVETKLGFALTAAAQVYDIAYLSAERGTSNCSPAGQEKVEARMTTLLDGLAALAVQAEALPNPPPVPELPAWAMTGVAFTTTLFADQHVALAACEAAEPGLRQGWLDWVGQNLPAALELATTRYDATLARGRIAVPDCAEQTVATGRRNLELNFADLQRLAGVLAGRLAAPPSWGERLSASYATCDADAGQRDTDCYCLAEAAANRAGAAPAALQGELDATAERRCAEPQALRVVQYGECIALYGAFVTDARRARAERLCGCVASHMVRHFRELSLPVLRTQAIDACLSARPPQR